MSGPGSRRSWLRRPLTQLGAVLVVFGVAPLVASLAEARPGGGQSYSGGGGGYSGGGFSGGGSSGGGGLSDDWAKDHWDRVDSTSPHQTPSSSSGSSCSADSCGGAVILLGVPFVWVLFQLRGLWPGVVWDSSESSRPPPFVPPKRSLAREWALLRALDPDFSRVVFDDFVYRLYASAHEARNDPNAMDALLPYLSSDARQQLRERESDGPISNIVIGSMTVTNIVVPTTERGSVEIEIVFEANLAVGPKRSEFVLESWKLVRSASVRSRPPEAVRALRCPNCAAPFEAADDQRCKYCNEIVTDGRFDWFVESVHLLHSHPNPPTLGGYAPEVGTADPTRYAASVQADWQRLQSDDHLLTQPGFLARVRTIYERLNPAWVARDLGPVRGYLSAGMQDYLQYWIDAYRRSGLVNQLDDMGLEQVEIVKIVRDRYYDAITVRLWASGLDYTIEESNRRLVGGSSSTPRHYSEYWTLIRGSGVRGPARTNDDCPNCGARLQITMAGNCEHCGAHLTRGEFDWVLSRIEQDEAYRG